MTGVPPETPPRPADADADAPPPAPTKVARPQARPQETWSEVVQGMQTMPVEEARKLNPRDIGVRMGPIMDEAQFREYCKMRKTRVRIIEGVNLEK